MRRERGRKRKRERGRGVTIVNPDASEHMGSREGGRVIEVTMLTAKASG